jgi:hypothetical protein
VFWTTTQLLTVSSQLKDPISRRSAFVVDLLAALSKEAPPIAPASTAIT